MGPGKADLKPRKADLRLGRSDVRPGRADLGFGRADLRSCEVYLIKYNCDADELLDDMSCFKLRFDV